MKRASMSAMGACVSLILAACGGGGGDDDGSFGGSSRAEGAYEGTTSQGLAFQALVLEDDTLWSIYGPISGGVYYIAGFTQGPVTVNGNQLTSSALRSFTAGGVFPSTLSGSFVAGTSISGTLTTAGSPDAFTGTTVAASDYDYNAPARQADAVGTWSMPLSGSPVSVTVTSTGAFTGSMGACALSGTVTPRASGKNVFNVALTFGGSPCQLPNTSLAGIGIPSQDGASRQLVVAAVDSARNNGVMLVLAR